MRRPNVYQQRSGSRQPVAARYVLQSLGRVGFQVESYDASRPLVIDPVLAYSTFRGGAQNERGWDIAVDAAGRAHVTGVTLSTDFPLANEFQSQPGSLVDAFVTKLDASGSALEYSTYLGGSFSDSGIAIALDDHGNAYVAGQTLSGDFPTTADVFQRQRNGLFFDAFVTKLTPAGQLSYSTYLGGTLTDGANDVAVDALGNAFVVGGTLSSDFPITPGAFRTLHAGFSEGFVAKLDPRASTLVYSTFLGGSGVDATSGVAIDPAGTVVVVGGTDSRDFPVTAGAFQTLCGRADD